MTPLIQARNVAYSYGTHEVLRDVSFKLDPGLHFLLGVNGAGKTTLFRIILGALKAAQGSIAMSGDAATTNGVLDRVGYLPQRFGTPGHLRVGDFVAYVAWLRGMRGAQLKSAATDALALVDMRDHTDSRLAQLSGGMLRRVGIAQAIVHRPAVLLLDEPTDGLDPKQRVNVRELLSSLSQHMCLLVSTHLLEDIRETRGEVLILDDGVIAFQGDSEGLMASTGKQTVEAAFLRVTGS